MQISAPIHRFGVALLRVVVGIIFLWAGLEKILGAGLGTWSAGGFLQFGTTGTLGWPFVTGEVAEGTVFNPTHDFWVRMAQNETALGLIDYLVPLGQLGTTDDCGFAPFCDDTSTTRDTAFAKIRARLLGTALAAERLGVG